VRELFLNDQLRCGQFGPAECGQINRRMHSIFYLIQFYYVTLLIKTEFTKLETKFIELQGITYIK
jgi:hypothetical protein